jgi:hypothetical protein
MDASREGIRLRAGVPRMTRLTTMNPVTMTPMRIMVPRTSEIARLSLPGLTPKEGSMPVNLPRGT